MAAWDSNPGRQDGMRRQFHWAMAAPQIFVMIRCLVIFSFYSKLACNMKIVKAKLCVLRLTSTFVCQQKSLFPLSLSLSLSLSFKLKLKLKRTLHLFQSLKQTLDRQSRLLCRCFQILFSTHSEPNGLYWRHQWSWTLFSKKGPTPASLFVYFRSFQTQILHKNSSLQRDSNSDRRSRRRARWPLDHHHGPTLEIKLQLFVG